MTEQQKHLKSVIEQQNALVDEISKLNTTITIKKENAIKLQGIIEYLTGIGVKLPEEGEQPEIQPTEAIEE